MKKYSKLIFDIDYTILIPDWSKEDDYFKDKVDSDKLEQFYKEKQSILDKYESIVDKYDYESLKDYFKENGYDISVDVIKGWIEYNSHEIIDTLPEGIVELFKYLKDNNISIVILTSWFSYTQIERLKRAGLYEYIDKIITGEEATKNNLKGFELAIETTPKEQCLMVGDSPVSDLEGSKKSGIDCYLVTKENTIKKLLEKLKSE